MCPVCLSSVALITAGVTSTGGIATLVVSRLRRNNQTTYEKDLDKNEERETWMTARDKSR